MKIKPIYILIGVGGLIGLSSIAQAIKTSARNKKKATAYSDLMGSIAISMFAALYPGGEAASAPTSWYIPLSFVVDFFVSEITDTPPDKMEVIKIANSKLTKDNFEDVSKWYSSLYDRLLFDDLKDRLGSDFPAFDAAVNKSQQYKDNPEMQKDVLKNLAKDMYEDLQVSVWDLIPFSGGADDTLYETLETLNDDELTAVNGYYKALLIEDDREDDSLLSDLKATYTVDNLDILIKRFRDLGLR